ncbi:MAG TPA: 4'-phosphopantetheinyl transferase superfamily protein [Casimicrobiaceae bacterium]|nr:4'-phosphopantetheinyl transferase superfamily protein [Casimicrobiaceae bacterium]
MQADRLAFLAPQSLSEDLRVSAAQPGVGEIDVWGFGLDAPGDQTIRFESLLDSDERERARRLLRPRDRERFIAAHGATRLILAAYVGLHPTQIRFVHSAHGKPHLVPVPGCADLTFSLSHSRERGLLAVARGRPVGADLECTRDDIDVLAIARRFFSPQECDALGAVAAQSRSQAFFRYWVAKEALLKAVGVGLTLPTDRFTLRFVGDLASVQPHELAQLEAYQHVRTLDIEAGWYAAFCAAGRDWTLRFRTGR